MKTAEEILKEHGVLNVYDTVKCSKYDIIHLMNVYAKQVAKEALKNADKRVGMFPNYRNLVEDKILNESNIPSL